MTQREGRAPEEENGPDGGATEPIEDERGRRVARRGQPQVGRPPTPSEAAVHIDDRISKVFVVGIAVAFGLIFLNALLLGQGGLLAPQPAPPATPPAVVTPTPTPAASPTPAATPTP
jgi:hypothetical protein